jgi:hypothetical protein
MAGVAMAVLDSVAGATAVVPGVTASAEARTLFTATALVAVGTFVVVWRFAVRRAAGGADAGGAVAGDGAAGVEAVVAG